MVEASRRVGTGHSGGSGAQALALLAGLIAIGLSWPVVSAQIPLESQFAVTDLVLEHWADREGQVSWLNRRWAWLALHNYHLWFAIAVMPGVAAVAAVQAIAGRSPLPVMTGPPSAIVGALLGYWLYEGLREESWALAVPMPATFAFLGGAVGARLAAPASNIRHLRGTRIRRFRFGPVKRLHAKLTDRVTLLGVPLSREDETRHIAAIGATGSGKSTALRALMAAAVRRGDRHVVADPEGSAMDVFFRDGDIILNPFDPRCAKWDLLSEIEGPSDYAFIAQSLLPHSGTGEHDQWVTYAQQLLAGAMENFVTLELGSSDDFVAMLQSASLAELKQLCAGTPAQRYFDEGGERMLASILGTMAPAIGHLRSIAAIKGRPFSLRHWIRHGRGSIWFPYAANQTAALRGLVSCWMNIAVLETMSLEPSQTRRIWFHIDELDALGRIEGLKDAQARLRKYGGCVAIGFQSFSQIRQIYGEGAHTIIENCGNLLLLRAGASADGGTAKLASDLIGLREVEREDVSRSRTRSKVGSSSTSSQTKRSIDSAALASELAQLRPGTGFLKRASKAHWLHIKS